VNTKMRVDKYHSHMYLYMVTLYRVGWSMRQREIYRHNLS